MIASEDYRIPLMEGELEELIRRTATSPHLQRGHVHCALGSGDLIWNKGEPVPWAVKELAKMRGVDTENVGGDGI